MAPFRLTLTGSRQEMDLLETFCRNFGVATERGVLSAYEGVAVTLFAVYITAPIEIVSQCVAAYCTRKAPLKLTFFVPGKGTFAVQDLGLNGIAKTLAFTDQLHIEEAWT